MKAPAFDSHLHLTDSRFDEDRRDVLARARADGVGEMVTVATNPTDARAALELAEREERIWATAGLHPHEALDYSDGVLDELRRLAGRERVVAIGETGLDFHYENAPRSGQIESFLAQMELAGELGLPVVVHSRDADRETADLIRRFEGRVCGVLHCFTGGEQLLEAGLSAGWYISFSGIVTFAAEVAERVAGVPDDRLLIETDSPYLAPVPRRGRRNEPAFLTFTCARVAELRGRGAEEIAELTRGNARELYGLPGAPQEQP